MRGSGSGTRHAAHPGRGVVAAAVAAGALVAVAAAAWMLADGRLPAAGWVEGPAATVRRALREAGAGEPEPLPAVRATLRLDRLAFRDVLVDGQGDRVGVVAVADADGVVEWRGESILVAYLGRERLTMARCAERGWCPEGERLPRLASLLATLVRRAAAFDDGDGGAYRPLVSDDYRGEPGGKAGLMARLGADLAAQPRARLRPVAWQVRIERETAQVGEDFELAMGGAPARRLRARLELREEGGHWRFTGGL